MSKYTLDQFLRQEITAEHIKRLYQAVQQYSKEDRSVEDVIGDVLNKLLAKSLLDDDQKSFDHWMNYTKKCIYNGLKDHYNESKKN